MILNLRNESGRVGGAELFLLLLILCSVGYVGYTVFYPPVGVEGVNETGLPAAQIAFPPAAQPGEQSGDARPAAAWQSFHSKLKSIGDSNWGSLTDLSRQLVPQSRACGDRSVPEQRALAFWDIDFAKQVASGSLDFMIDPTGLRCLRQGLKLGILRYSDKPEDPYVSFLGEVEVLSVFVLPGRVLPESFLKRAGKTRAEMDAALKWVTPSRGKGFSEMTLIRVKSTSGFVAPSKPLAHFTFSSVGAEHIDELLKKLNRFRVIDLRTEEERASAPIAGAVFAPYRLSAGNRVFKWSLTNKELLEHEFNVSELFAAAHESDLPLLIVGGEPNDGRPVWALKTLLKTAFGSGYWYRDGGRSLREAIDRGRFGQGNGVVPFDRSSQ